VKLKVAESLSLGLGGPPPRVKKVSGGVVSGGTGVSVGVAVGGSGVSVEVAVGGMAVSVGVAVGGTGVLVGVSVEMAVGGTRVCVGVAVGGTGVLVGVGVGVGVGAALHTRLKHCAGSVLPVARLPPPSIIASPAYMPQPLLLSVMLALRICPPLAI
jgi:hypothetical protein